MSNRARSESWPTGPRRRREIRAAVRGEWELEPRARGWAAVRSFARQVGELEQARLVAHAEAARREPIARPVARSPRDGAPAGAAGRQRAKRA